LRIYCGYANRERNKVSPRGGETICHRRWQFDGGKNRGGSTSLYAALYVSHKPGGRLPLLSAWPAVIPATLGCYQFCCLVNRGTMGVNSLPKTVTRQRRDCDLNLCPSAPESSTLSTRPTRRYAQKYNVGLLTRYSRFIELYDKLLCRRPRGDFGIARSVRLSVRWRSCLGYSLAGCLQLSHCRPPEMCGLLTRPRTDVDPPRFLPLSNCHRRGHIVSPPPGRYLVTLAVSVSTVNSQRRDRGGVV